MIAQLDSDQNWSNLSYRLGLVENWVKIQLCPNLGVGGVEEVKWKKSFVFKSIDKKSKVVWIFENQPPRLNRRRDMEGFLFYDLEKILCSVYLFSKLS